MKIFPDARPRCKHSQALRSHIEHQPLSDSRAGARRKGDKLRAVCRTEYRSSFLGLGSADARMPSSALHGHMAVTSRDVASNNSTEALLRLTAEESYPEQAGADRTWIIRPFLKWLLSCSLEREGKKVVQQWRKTKVKGEISEEEWTLTSPLYSPGNTPARALNTAASSAATYCISPRRSA